MTPPAAPPEATRLGELSSYQWKSGIAAWLGWLFDGLELHLYTLVATPLVIHLLAAASAADPAVKEKTAYIQAAFLIGWAAGGAFFRPPGRHPRPQPGARAYGAHVRALHRPVRGIADMVAVDDLPFRRRTRDRRRMGCRGVASHRDMAAGLASVDRGRAPVGRQSRHSRRRRRGRPAVTPATSASGTLRLSPRRAAGAARVLDPPPRARAGDMAPGRGGGRTQHPGVRELFRGAIARTTWITTVVCALSLSAWWLFVFWHSQHLRKLLGATSLAPAEITQRVSAAFFGMIAVSIVGNFASGWLAIRIGNRRRSS